MPSNNQTADSNFTAIFEAASNQYESLTGQDLGTHPFAVALNSYNSTESILNVFREQAQAFDKIRKRGNKLMAWLTPIVHILFTFSETLGAAISLPFLPAKTIFTGIGILLGAVKDVIASYETLVYIFERIQFFLQRLSHYTAIRLTPEMTELLGKIMAQVLSILAFSTKALKERRIKTVLKRLVGKTDVKDALARLDTLTKEENLMTVARTLEVIHHVDDNATTIKEAVHDVDGNVKATKELTHQVDQNVLAIKEVVSDVGGDSKATKELTYDIHKNVAVTEELVHDVRNDVGVIKGETHGVGRDVKVIKRAIDIQQRDHLRDKLRRWLAPPNPSINHSTACDIQHDGTAHWFIRGDTFGEWKKNGSLLWIRGNPGSGKSILCCAIIEDIKNMRESGSALVAYYYFDFKEVAKRHVRGLLTSLLMQLCDGSDSCWDIFSQFYTRCGNGQEYPGDAALVQCLKAMLDLPGQVPVYIIIDALDECPNNIGTPSARERVLNFLEDLVLCHRSNLFMCITSRPEQDIQFVLSPLISTRHRVSLHDEGGQREDINSYIRYFVQNDRAMRRWRDEDKRLVIAILSERANGMFRWVYCQLDNLRRCMPSSIRKALLDELPTTLDETYERILQGIPKQKWQHAHRLFQCMAAAVRPLRVEELGEIFAIEFSPNVAPALMEGWRPESPEDAVLSACSTLISIDDQDSKVVQFSHFSVKEFLTSNRLQTSDIGNISHFHILLESAHIILVRACLAVLLHLDEKVDKNRLLSLPLAFYAAEYWVDHAKFGNVPSHIENSMKDLFDPTKPHFRAWIWIHDMEWGRLTDQIKEHPLPPRATSLYYAALCGFNELVEHLMDAHAEDVNAYFSNTLHGTALQAASRNGHVDTARLLLECGANVNGAAQHRSSPLSAAYRRNHPKVVELLLEHGANVEDRRGISLGTALDDASFNGKVEMVDLLLWHNADVNAKGYFDQVPLALTSHRGYVEIGRLLLEHGSPVDPRSRSCNTPLFTAAEQGHLEFVRLLIGHGADVRLRGEGHRIPFQAAIAGGHDEVAQLLLEHGGERE